MHTKMIEFHVPIFAWFPSAFRPPFHALVAYHLEKSGMILHDAVWVSCKKGATIDISVQMPSI